MTPATYNFVLFQGATWDRTFTWESPPGTPVNLTGCTARLQLRVRDSDPDPPLLELTSQNGGITLGGAAGTVAVVITPAQSSALAFKTANYDLEIVWPSGRVDRFLQGTITLDTEVTR